MNGIHVTRTRLGQLDCTIVDALPPDTPPKLAVVLCHGFGAPGSDLVPLAGELLRIAPSLADTARFVFPAAPLSLDELGMFGGRAWWMLDIEALNRTIETGQMRDQRHLAPDGLSEASSLLAEAVEDLQRQNDLAPHQVVLGGFSQGSMVATDVALRMPAPPAALAILSGTLLCEKDWRELAQRRGSFPVLQSHGVSDRILPFQGAIWLRDMLQQAGIDVDFIEFAGVHTIPPQAMDKLASLLVRVAAS